MGTEDESADGEPSEASQPFTVGRAPPRDLRSWGALLATLAFTFLIASVLLEPGAAWKVGLAAAVMGFAASALGNVARRIVQLTVDPGRDTVTLVTNDGGRVDLPVAAIECFECQWRKVTKGSDAASSLPSHLAVLKRDGGRLETTAFPSGELERTRIAAERLNQVLAEARADSADAAFADPRATLRTIRGVAVATPPPPAGDYRSQPVEDALDVAWAAQSPWLPAACGLSMVGGLGVVFRDLGSAPGAGSFGVAAWIMGALALAVIVFFGLAVGVRVHIRIDDEGVTVERRRFRQKIASRTWPLADVDAIDLSVTSNTTTLTVRTADDEVPVFSPGQSPVLFVAGVVRHAGQINQLPLGALSLADGLLLDLALSSELARRKGVEAGTV